MLLALGARLDEMTSSGDTLIEATSGNTGIALAFFAKELGHPITIVMPEDMTEERKSMIRALGAELVLSSKEGSFAEAAATVLSDCRYPFSSQEDSWAGLPSM